MNKENLLDTFKKTGLDLVILNTPIRTGTGMDQIFQLDIERTRKGLNRWERFRIYMGASTNEIQVRDIDKEAKQLVLMVHEPERLFTEEVKLTSRITIKRIEDSRPKPVKVEKVSDELARVTRKTVKGTRYFLMGVDERQLFIAQLKDPCTTITEARKSLGGRVIFADGARNGSVLDRQGEWFFLETNESTRQMIEDAIKGTRTTVHKNVAIGNFMNRRGGNPHTVSELVIITADGRTTETGLPGRRRPGGTSSTIRPRRIYVRGSVRHKDHKTVKFNHWREVVVNNEGSTATATANGIFWVD